MAGKETFVFDLDNKDFLKGLGAIQSGISNIGSPGTIAPIIAAFQSMLGPLALITTAVMAVKAAFDFTLQGEEIKSINYQFDMLTKNAGLSGEALKKGLMGAAEGLIDETDLMKQANNVMIGMGDSASRLTEVLELSRKIGIVSGKDLSTTFNEFSQALMMGNVRALKHYQIIIDSETAYKKYADRLGVGVGVLSEVGKRQAILNEALDKGQKQYKDVDKGLRPATDAWTRFKVALIETKEAMATAIDKIFGKTFETVFNQMAGGASKLALIFTEKFATGAKQAKAEMELLLQSQASYQDQINKFEKAGPIMQGVFTALGMGIQTAKINLEETTLRLEELKQKYPELSEEIKKQGDAVTANDAINKERQLKAESTFTKEMNEFRKQILDARLESSLTEVDAEAAAKDKLIEIELKYQDKIAQITADQDINTQQRSLLLGQATIAMQEELTAAQMNLAFDVEKAQEKALQRQGKVADGFFNKFASGAHLASFKAKKDFLDFSKLGEDVVGKFGDAIENTFAQCGQAGWQLGEALKKAMIGAIGDICVAEGKKVLAMSIWPPQPLGIAAGTALIALGGLLKSSVSATGKISGGAESAGGAISAPEIPKAAREEVLPPSPEEMQKQQKSVSIIIQGHWFNTEETQRKLTEMIRQSADATDFKVMSVGGGL